MSDNVPIKREDGGKWAKGSSGNPVGRPLGKKAQIDVLKQDLEFAVRKAVSADRITAIVNKILDEAEKGSVKAAKLIFDTFLTKASTETEGDRSGQGITIRIENATFAAIAANKEESKAPIEGQFQEVTEKSNG